MKRLLYLHWLYTWDYRAVVEIIPGCESMDMNRNKKCTDYFLWNNLRVSSVLQQFSEWIVEELDQERNLLRLDIKIVRFLILYWLTWRQQTGQNIPTFLIPQDGHAVVVDDRWFACDWRLGWMFHFCWCSTPESWCSCCIWQHIEGTWLNGNVIYRLTGMGIIVSSVRSVGLSRRRRPGSTRQINLLN